ncbi:MAG: TIR domain-containing protein [Sphingomonadaceae bacterium]|nr:TIR domain-containing protein [Sphingomonadaceae bacterium]
MSDDQAGAARKPIAFISHHNSQEKVARHVKAVFERNGVIGWMAPDDIEPGLQFDRAIIEQVKKSDIIVLLFCAQSDQSKHVKREIMLAEDQDKLIYPVRLEAIEPSGLAYWLQDYQWIDWVDRRDATIERMLATVKRQVAARDAANPPVPAVEEETAPDNSTAVEPPSPEPTVEAAAPPPPVRAPAGPAMSAPMPLLGDGAGPLRDIDAADDGGTEEIAARPTGFIAKIDRNGWIAIGVVGALLVVLLGIAFANMGGSSDADGDFAVNPGMWEARVDDVNITFPELEPGIAEEYAREIADNSVSEGCITEDEAADPDASILDLDGEENCEIDEFSMEDGTIVAELSCRPTALEGGEATYALRGDYTRTGIEGQVSVVSAHGTPNAMNFSARFTSERTGRCR